MTLKLNQAALTVMLESREGPVGRLVQRRAEAAAVAAVGNARTIMWRKPGAADAVDMAMDDQLHAVIGIRDQGSISQYLADKALGRVNARSAEQWPVDGWLKAALREEFGS